MSSSPTRYLKSKEIHLSGQFNFGFSGVGNHNFMMSHFVNCLLFSLLGLMKTATLETVFSSKVVDWSSLLPNVDSL